MLPQFGETSLIGPIDIVFCENICKHGRTVLTRHSSLPPRPIGDEHTIQSSDSKTHYCSSIFMLAILIMIGVIFSVAAKAHALCDASLKSVFWPACTSCL